MENEKSKAEIEGGELATGVPPVSSPAKVVFANPSEEEFARILDFYRIQWQYEPRSFPLNWEGSPKVEMFTPDFYLPELDLYIELTTLKQSLVTAKNRKLRRLRQLYPDINIKLLYRKDYHRLLAKYGYGPLGKAKIEALDRILLSAPQIQRRVSELGAEITTDYVGRRPLLVGVLKGVACFMADLMRSISLPLTIDFMAVSHYEDRANGAVRIVKDLDQSVTGCHVLMVEDIVDTGMTLHYILNYLAGHKPASLEVCTLLDKRSRRLVDVPLKYIGFEIPDEFVVGYGLDFGEEYRNLPYIAVLKPEAKAEPTTPEGSR